MRTLVGHRWAVGVAALMLVFALGAISWAATGDATAVDPAPDSTVGTPGPGFGMAGLGGIASEGDFAAFGQLGRHGRLGGAITDEMKAQMEERRAQMEAQRKAFNDLIREKMSAEDQAAFDSLLAAAQTQRDELQKAQEALQGTASKIRDLVGKYFPPADATSGATSGTAGTGATGTSGTTGTTSLGL